MVKQINCGYCEQPIKIGDIVYKYNGVIYCTEECLDSEIYLGTDIITVDEDMLNEVI